MSVSPYLFKTSQLQKTYTSSSTVDEPTLHYRGLRIPRGGFIAIIGQSGTGKTTLLNMLGGLDAPDKIEAPSIEIDLGNGPINIVKKPDAYPRSSVGYIFQEGYLLLNATVGMNIALPMIQKGHDVTRQDLEPIFQDIKLPTEFLNRRAWQLSGGQSRRVAFARAVSHNPKLILADEPTNDLDSRLANELIQWLKNWCQQEPDRTILWVTYDLKPAAANADGIIILRNGSEDYPLKNPGNEELIKQWVYGEKEIAPEYQIELELQTEQTENTTKPDSGSKYIKFKAMLKVALAEIFSRQSALNNGPLNAKLSLAGQNTKPARVPVFNWFSSFGQWSSAIVLILITLLALMGILSGEMITQHFDRSINDPRNCHILITGNIARISDPLSKSEIQRLSERHWEKTSHSSNDTESNEIYPLASCTTGPAAFGRRDAREFDIALAQDGQCLHSDESVRLLITEPYEPILQKILLLDADEQAQYSLAHYFRNVHIFPQTNEIYLTSDIEKALLKEKNKTLLEQQICIVDYNRGWKEIYTVKGIVDDLPSGGRQIFHAYITEEAYQALRRRTGDNLLEGFTDVAVYFSSSDVDRVKKYLDKLELVYVEDNLTKIRNLMLSSVIFKGIVSTILIVIGFLLIFFIAMSVHNYLLMNAKSFAVLKSFGLSKRFMTGILVLQFTIGWLVSIFILAIVTFLTSLFLLAWLVPITGLELSHEIVGISFIVAIVGVFSVGLIVSLEIVRRWWNKNQYVSDLLKST
jgi:ABC-type lipoprotein export system ATPase subunit